MQDHKKENTGEKDKSQQIGQDRPTQESYGPFEPIKIDRQEGNMNHGTLGGNFGEDAATKADDQLMNDHTDEPFSPP
ncbi:hypothetical protein OCK74_07520 [Chitinophagaceae bacterium LB-8]|uniref:Uncharacterized protein n=1 Tax=Paraflavisolibacter caeni TaxID=2982496 RepID=A0A9X3B794_9BACT|nr:hypothetical protein [Paraflavisolibacter caeni]MCU7548960.1 hypothetical protein [Paraflavisolibacter caeni]